jgi:hypothetical protein
MNNVVKGLVAGAAGATALNAMTYLDMALRARPASSAGEESVQRMAELAHVDVGSGETAENRKAGLGPLFGYATSIAVAVTFSAARGTRLPIAASAAVLTGLAMAASSGPMTALKVTDPRQWNATDWVTDLVPHAVFGWVTAVTLDRLR